jgi:hypothetical protein
MRQPYMYTWAVYTVQAWSAHGDLYWRNFASYTLASSGGQGDREI